MNGKSLYQNDPNIDPNIDIYFEIQTDGSVIVYNVQPDDPIRVIVTGNANVTGLGQEVSVTLGNTGPNDNSEDTQNQIADVNPSNLQTQAIGDAPANNEREASAFQSATSGQQIVTKPLALALLLKTGQVTSSGSSTTNSDNIITYNLQLKVESQSPDSDLYIPEDLVGTPINLEGSEATRILISDAIPGGTELTGIPQAPLGWTVVYTIEPNVNKSLVITDTAPLNDAVEWTTTAPTLADVTRVGFIKDTVTTGRVAVGTTVSGFSFQVETVGLAGVSGGTVNNIAQVFGRTYNDPGNPIEPVDQIIYDESGDQRPNNFNDDNTAPDPDGNGSSYDPLENDGIADPVENGVDPGGNQGEGPFGEVNKITINAILEPNLFIGPEGEPDAFGPTDNNDDFTNKSVPGTVNLDANTVQVATSVTFTNTVKNTTSATLNNVVVEPITPTQANAIPSSGDFGADTDIPLGTKVVVTLKDSGNSVTYVYIDDGGTKKWVREVQTELPNRENLAVGAELDYTVEITFPPTADLVFLEGYSVPIAVFSAERLEPSYATVGVGDGFEAAYNNEKTGTNVTINRVYAGGFMKLEKQARILDADGQEIEGFSDAITAQPKPGEFIEYRITYENVSTPTPSSDSGNAILNATNFRIVEHGTDGGNTWATNNNTLHWQNTSATTGNIFFYNNPSLFNISDVTPSTVLNSLGGFIGNTDPSNSSSVGVYINQIGTVAPQGTGEFIFRRQVRDSGNTNP